VVKSSLLCTFGGKKIVEGFHKSHESSSSLPKKKKGAIFGQNRKSATKPINRKPKIRLIRLISVIIVSFIECYLT